MGCCSRPEDQKSIVREIGDFFKEKNKDLASEAAQSCGLETVDFVVKVLMDATMSTPSLRAATKFGVEVRYAGFLQYSHTFAGWWLWMYVSNCSGTVMNGWYSPGGV